MRKGYCLLVVGFVVMALISIGASFAQNEPWAVWVKKEPEILTPWKDYADLPGVYGNYASLGELIAAIKASSDNGATCEPTEVTPSGSWVVTHPDTGVKHLFANVPYGEFSKLTIKTTLGSPPGNPSCAPQNIVTNEIEIDIRHRRGVQCPAESVQYTPPNGNFSEDGICRAKEALTCTPPQTSGTLPTGGAPTTVGNPCSPISGDKSAIEKDFHANNGLGYIRYYHSRDLHLATGAGTGWRHNYSRRWIEGNIATGGYLENNSGYKVPMVWSTSLSKYKALGANGVEIEQQGNEWILQRNSNVRDIYNDQGLLIRVETNNKVTQLSYQNGLLVRVEDSFGHFLVFTYNSNNLIETVEDQSNIVYRYEYDALGNLTAVVYPDLTPSDNSDNPKRIYHYENTDYPNHLTGITDANGNRYATYVYDPYGQAISTEHAETTTNGVGQERFQLDYIN